MTHVHYKFSSKLSYDTVVFDGPHVTLRDLKRQIMGREKLRSGDCDLQITSAQTKEEYTDDEGMIPKGSSVIVRRIPIIGVKSTSNKTRNIERSDAQFHHAFGAIKAMDDQNSSRAFFSKMTNLADADVSEEDKIQVMLNQSTAYDSMNYNKKFGGVLPANYTCYRCGNTGHHIRNCPTSGDKNVEAPLRIKKSTGIPRSFMVEVDDPNIKGAMLTNCGHYAIPAIHAKAYAIGKKEKPPFVPQEQPKSEDKEDPVPDELLCLICHDLLSDAVVIPCCGNSYCDDCIRNALLDSEEHVCPTCNQSDVSPDTLIANKFLRQAVNTFKKERGQANSLGGRCGTSQSQNPTLIPSPVPTPPPIQSQPPKPYQSSHSQQDPLLYCSQVADTPPSSQECGAPPTATSPASAAKTPSPSLQPAQSHLEISDKEAEEKTHDDSAAAAPSVLVSHKDPTAAPLQLMPLVNDAPAAEQPQTVSVNLQQSPAGPAARHPGPPTCWDSSPSSGCPPGGWNKSNTQQLPPSSSSSSYPATPPPLFPSPLFHTFLAAQQPLNSYPPGYPPTTPVWTLPTLQGAPIPSLCSSTSASSIPALIPKEWYMNQRNKKERSPHRGSTYRHSSSRSNSKSSKPKSGRSYSHSSSRSRSRSRSRSQGRSRPHSPYSRHRDLHSRSHSSHSYSYGYKRSPTPSSSSSPRVGYDSRSKSPSDHRKNSHHSWHHSKKSASSSYSSKRRGERSQRESGGSGGNFDSYLYAQHAEPTGSLGLDRERYLQWKREYKEWCEKYFNSYVGHFHQLPPPPLNLPPSLLPQWGDREGSRNPSHANSESRSRPQGRRTSRKDERSPPSQSSSDSRSPPPQSSSHSTPSQSSSDSRSTPSRSSNESHSPPSRSSSDGRSTPSEDGAQLRGYQQRCAQKYSRLPITKGSEKVELQETSKDDKHLITKKNLRTLKYEQESMKNHEEGRGEESSTPDAADTGPNTCKDGTPIQDRATASEALKSVQPLLKPDKRFDKDYKRKSGEQRNLEIEKGWRRDKYSGSRQDVEGRRKEKPSKGVCRVDTDRYNKPGGSKASDSRSEKNRKRKGEDMERSSVRAQSSRCLKTEVAEVPTTRKSESPDPFDRKKQKTEKKKERKTWPLTERDIWEGGVMVKPQKKISININLDGKRKEEKTEKQDSSYLESIKIEKTDNVEEEKSNRGETEVKEKKESCRDEESLSEEKIKPDERQARPIWEKATFRDDKAGMREKVEAEKKESREEDDFDLWHSILTGVEEAEEKKESKKQLEEGDGMEGRKVEELTNDQRVGNDGVQQEMGELVAGAQKERAEGENRGNPWGESKPKGEMMERVKWRMRKEDEDTVRSESQRRGNKDHHEEPNTTVDDGSSYEDQERKRVVTSVKEYTQNRATDREEELVLIQVPRSKWEKEESEEGKQDEEKVKVEMDAFAMFLPQPSMSVTAETPADRETEGEHEQKRQRSVETERDGARSLEREKNSSSHRSVAPSSGKDRPDSTMSAERDRERGMEMERPRDRERGRESERQRDRQKESKRSKERTREEEKGRDMERERGHGSNASVQKRNPPSSSHSYSYSTAHDTERRDRQRGNDQSSNKTSSSCLGGKSFSGRSWESSAISGAADLPDQHAYKIYKDTLLDPKFKDQDHSHSYYNHQDPPGNYRHQDRPAGSHHSPPSHSHSRSKERKPHPSKSSGGSEHSKPRTSSPGQNRKNKSTVEKGVWEQNRVIKEGKGERENPEMVAEREGGNQWEDEADKLDGQTKWEGGRELEEGERPSSSNGVSSSASQESSSDDGKKEWKKKQKKHNKERRQPAPELLEEGELKKHKHKKKSKKSRDGGGEERSGEVDNRWKEEEEQAKLCSLLFF
ncbi:E3 ubiquitin-protein ligase RBBP6 [Dicentrarchus labrax]|uniref:Retinoblastoma binding protein 6 n=2 Tax=Dicentrarchus labrax TaxID=13489 RepID=A0A8P4KTV0_DICLA|nr:E3 ubiquitin-protein ligase RBBP6 [Dicentrarchus labrax]